MGLQKLKLSRLYLTGQVLEHGMLILSFCYFWHLPVLFKCSSLISKSLLGLNQGKMEVVKQEMTSVNINILRRSELKWTETGKFEMD